MVPAAPTRPTPGPTGVVKGVSTASPSPSPSNHGAVSAATTPTTGAQLPIVISRVLIVVGLLMVFSGLLVWRRQRYFGHG